MSTFGQVLGVGGLIAVAILLVFRIGLGIARFVGWLRRREERRPGYLSEELIRKVRQ